MISRLTAYAATFAVLATASIAFAASAQQSIRAHAEAKAAAVVELPTVVVTGKRANLTDQ